MKHFTPNPSRRNVRVFLATLLSYLMLVGQVAPLALASNNTAITPAPVKTDAAGGSGAGKAQGLEAAAAPAPLAPFAPAITATKTDSFPDSDADGKAVPDEEITYDVTIANSGTDATNVQFTDTVDPNTTFVPGSVTMSPLARNDTYNATLNTQLVVAAASGVLANDSGIPAPTATAIAAGPTTQGGTVTLNTDGSFTYNPPNNFQGSDTFTYTATNSNLPNDTATVTINVDAAPTVNSTTPTNGATQVATNANISITFSEPVNVTGSWFTISCATSGAHTAVVTPASPATTFTLNPGVDFATGELCTVTVVAAQVTDQDSNDPPDNMAGNYVFTFTTDVPPSVSSTTPTNGATGIATNTNVDITFSEPVNVTGSWFTISCATSGAHTAVVTGGPTTFTLNPNADFVGNELCTVTIVAAQVTDQDSGDPPDNMTGNYVFTFTTDAAPSVSSTTPTNTATQVANNTNISITFSEPVNVTGAWFTISGATSGAHTAVVTGGPTTFTLNPDTDFTNGEVVSVNIVAAQVTDQDSGDPPDNMAANFPFSFTIDNPPTVQSTTPANNATGVSNTTNIDITFSEPVNVTGNWFQMVCDTVTVNPADAAVTGGPTTFTINPTNNLPEGVTCTMTIFAAQVADQDSGDPPDNMAANYVFSFKIPPRAVADARSATGNIRIVTTGRSNFSVLGNDVFPISDPVTVTAFDATSVKGGNVSIVSNTGTFSYNPPPGYEGADTFNYTITNGAGSSIGTVTITIAGMIWFIDDSATSCTTISAAAGCGRLTNPLSTLAAFEAANGVADTPASNIYLPAANDHIFIYAGSYTAPLTLENSQRVIGQGATSSLQTLSGVTPATDSDSLPSTTGLAADRPTITSAGNGFNVVSNNQLYGFSFSNTGGAAVNSNANVGTLVLDFIAINNASSNGAGIVLDDGGTSVTATGTDTINTRSGVGLSLTNATNIGAGNMTFKSISVGNSDGNADPANGIVLNNTGASGSLVVTGNGTNTVGGDASGGTIQNTTGDAISLTSTLSPSFTNVTIQFDPAVQVSGSGVHGTQVTNFTFKNSTVSNTGHNLDTGNAFIGESDLRFDTQSAGTENNVSGAVTITNNVLNNALTDGVRIFNFNGTISDLNISNNSLTSGTTTGTNGNSKGSGINVQILGSATTVSNLTKATIANNTIANFPGGSGITVQGGNASTTGTGGTVGTPGNATNVVSITGNNIHGQSSANKMGTSAIIATVGGGRSSSRSQGNFDISNNGTVANPLTNMAGISINTGANGYATLAITLDNNRIVANNTVASAGIAVAGGVLTSNAETPDMTAKVTNNNISAVDGNDILAITRGVTGFLKVTIKTNTVAAPLSGNREGIRVDAGNVNSVDDAVCLDISGNTSAGSGVATGIGLRKQGTSATVNDFGVEGMAATSSPGVEAFVNGQNPAGGGAELISATSGFTNCSSAPNGPETSDAAPAPSKLGRRPVADEARSSATRRDLIDADPTPTFTFSPNAPFFLFADAAPAAVIAPAVRPAPAVNRAPAADAPARVWSDMPVIITRTPSDSLTDDKSADEDAAKDDDSAKDSDAAPKKAKKPARTKKAGEPSEQQQQPDAQPETRNIAYFGPLGSAPSRAPQFVRASYEAGDAVRTSYEAGDAVVAPSTRTTNAKPALKAAPAVARATAAAIVGPDVNVSIGAMPAGKSVKIRFKVTVNNPFNGAQPQVSNQGSVSYAESGTPVLTDDPAVGGSADPTVTLINAIDIRVNDATAAEPATGTAQMLFTVTLSNPAPGGGLTLNYATANGGATPATGGASCGGAVDYVTTNGTLSFASGEKVKTVPVTVCADTSAGESNETLLLNITSPSTGSISDGQAVGTITQGTTPGTFIISELRTSGPGGLGDDFVELYNNTNSQLTVASSDASAGYGVYKKGADCNAAPVLVGTIPNGTIIPARVHYLFGGSTYSLANYGGTGEAAANQTLTSDIDSDANVAVFSTANVLAISSANRLDAVGFDSNAGSVCDLLREGNNLGATSGSTTEHSFFRKECDLVGGTCAAAGNPKDSNDNAADFMFASTDGNSIGSAGQRIGAPGPENLSSPIRRDTSGIGAPLLDASKASSAHPNRSRDFTPDSANNSSFGTMTIRRRVTNTTGGNVTRLRFRIIELPTYPVPPGTADLRVRTSVDTPSVGPVGDAGTCTASGAGSPPCSVLVRGTTLETPPNQPFGGGYNSTLSAGTITLGTPLANNTSINVQFLLGIQQTGTFRFFIIIEALP